jgi:type IV pilus assembly protein PilY1
MSMKRFSVTAPANSSPELSGKSTMPLSAHRLQQSGSPAVLKFTALAVLLLLASTGHAATADISQVPLATTKSAKPNIMFILDDSGSMSWDFMPDDVQPNMSSSVQPSGIAYPTANYNYWRYLRENTYGAWSAQCNGVAFDPIQPYKPPVKADGTSYPNAILHFPVSPSTTDPIINIVPTDGFASAADTANRTATQDCSAFDSLHPPAYCKLSGAFYYQYDSKIIDSQPALSWTYNTDGTVVKTSKFFTQCQSSIGSAPGNAFFTKKLIDSNTSADELQKYANWYAYYRTRQLTMRTAAGRAFEKMKEADGRIGFTVINDPTITSTGANAKFLETLDFTSTQKDTFFRLLYSSPADSGTPLRGSLSKIGKYFANKLPGQTAANGPIQYSCQRNFAILSTDGYWNNGSSGSVGQETSSYGPLRLDNTPIGNTDGSETPPMKDSAGSSDSLADVAQYYWDTDLRPDLTDDVAPLKDTLPPDPNRKQHLNTYTIGLGVKGTLSYDKNYLTRLDPLLSDFPALSSGAKNWPIPAGAGKENATHIDDLWHAAVNGRGQYFSAGSSDQLSNALVTTLDNIGSKSATGAAAATSTQTPVQTDKSVFIARYTAGSWIGDVLAYDFTVNPDGTLVAPDTSTGKEKWSVAKTLNSRVLTTSPRRILFNDGKNTLVDFTYANLTTANLASAFDNRCGVPLTRLATEILSQCPQLAATQKIQVTGDNLVKYLSGDQTLEQDGSNTATKVFRPRQSRLGDIVNASPVHVGKPPFQYADAGYSNFVTLQASRTRMLYVAANDGMLHAFNADASGVEQWAFIPSTVLPDLWTLADSSYKDNHRYFVDASPVLADVYDGSSWHTILVGGLGAGGRAYYALDVTTPAAPKLLWEFSVKDDANLGLALGKPIVTKNASGTWVVAFTSGANNINPGTGIGQLFVLSAMTGAKMVTPSIPTCVSGACQGDTTTPNNLLQINAWTVSPTDNTTKRYYGGDMLGNMWRFDADNLLPPDGIEATLLGTAVSADGKVQPITTSPVLNESKPNGQPIALVSFGTGRLLGLSDYSDMTTQSIYTIRDKLTDPSSLGLLRTSPAGASTAGLVQQTMKSDRSVTSTPVDWSDSAVNGWFVDLLPAGASATGERMIVNGVSFSNILAMATMQPTTDSNPCKPSGTSYLYQFGLETGQASQPEAFSDVITGLSVIVQEGSGEKAVLATTSKGEVKTSAKDNTLPPPPGGVKRTSWRELVD